MVSSPESKECQAAAAQPPKHDGGNTATPCSGETRPTLSSKYRCKSWPWCLRVPWEEMGREGPISTHTRVESLPEAPGLRDIRFLISCVMLFQGLPCACSRADSADSVLCVRGRL